MVQELLLVKPVVKKWIHTAVALVTWCWWLRMQRVLVGMDNVVSVIQMLSVNCLFFFLMELSELCASDVS